ncbi:unnamed protein product [Fraxinus pennsylvanica]|uniref:Uncharacterized protein n=1 Tax=Fraxinus pennsylvanica TaxID=56036 RepID=A0AAD1ZPI7_9LAMI|nr:unnamed protein product [Fraxinus pennsylvanica]
MSESERSFSTCLVTDRLNARGTFLRSTIDDEYANAADRNPKILLTTSRNPSAPLTQRLKGGGGDGTLVVGGSEWELWWQYRLKVVIFDRISPEKKIHNHFHHDG